VRQRKNDGNLNGETKEMRESCKRELVRTRERQELAGAAACKASLVK